VLTLVGAVLRLWQIADLPAEPGVDLPLIYLSAEDILNGECSIFFPLHPGREGLYIYLAAAYIKLFGSNYPALRSLSALVGTATIPVAFLLGRHLFDRQVGLLAAAFLAISRWHVILSRTGLRFILMPLMTLLLLLALSKALQNRKPLHWALVGCVLGWGFHTYNAWLVMPLVVAGGLFLYRLSNGDWQREDAYLLLFAIAIALMLFLPLARYAHDDPQMFTLRVASRLTGRETPLPPDLLSTLWQNVLKTAGMFNWTGDSVAHLNVPLKRQLGFVSGAFFPLGLAILLFSWRRYGFLLLSLIVSCLPTTLAIAFPQEVPNAGRASGAVGLVCLAAAVPAVLWCRGLVELWRRRHRNGWMPRARIIGAGAILLALFAECRETRIDYFEEYGYVLAGANYPLSTRLVETIGLLGQNGRVYLKAFPHFYDGNALRTQLQQAGIEWENELFQIPTDPAFFENPEGPVVFLLHPQDFESLELIEGIYPDVAVFIHYDNHGVPAFLTLVLP
jgi:4-amino-4-deoxy-L-arabinose transferase-like glycosyltransferase